MRPDTRDWEWSVEVIDDPKMVNAWCMAGGRMAIYTGRLSLADAFAAPLVSDRPDGLWPTVVTDELGVALGLVYSSADSLRKAIEEHKRIFRTEAAQQVAAAGV